MYGIIIFFSEKVFKILLISLIVHDSLGSTANIFSMILKEIHLFHELVRMPYIIMILDSNVVSLCFREEEIESIIRAEILFAFYEFHSSTVSQFYSFTECETSFISFVFSFCNPVIL